MAGELWFSARVTELTGSMDAVITLKLRYAYIKDRHLALCYLYKKIEETKRNLERETKRRG